MERLNELVCIGTGDAFGSGGRRQSAYLLRTGGAALLLDCGQTTLTGLAALGIARDEVEVILISHFHADHFGGLPLFLVAAQYADARRKPLTVAGPTGIEARVRALARATGHPLERNFDFPLRFVEVTADARLELGALQVEAFETFHAPDTQPHGFKLLQQGAPRIAYSGDTGWFDALPERVGDVELFLCECTQLRRGFHYHLSLEELSARRGAFDCRRWLLTHLGAEMRARARQPTPGFEVADDGLVIPL